MYSTLSYAVHSLILVQDQGPHIPVYRIKAILTPVDMQSAELPILLCSMFIIAKRFTVSTINKAYLAPNVKMTCIMEVIQPKVSQLWYLIGVINH